MRQLTSDEQGGEDQSRERALLSDVGRTELMLVALMVLGVTAYRVSRFEKWIQPSIDWEQYRAVTVALMNGRMAAETPVGPGTSLGVLMLQWLMPGPDPLLHAGSVLSLLTATGSVLLMWLICRSFLSAGPALVAAWAFGYHPEMTTIALQPSSDAPFLFFVLLAFWLDRNGSRWAYAAGGAAALVRYQGGLIVMVLLARDLIVHRDRIRHALIAAASSAPVVIWFFLLQHASGASPYGGASSLIERAFYPKFLLSTGITILEVFPRPYRESAIDGDIAALAIAGVILLTVAALAVFGVFRMLRIDRGTTIVMVVFSLLLTFLHIRLPFAPGRYVLPIMWVIILTAFVGGEKILDVVAKQGKTAGLRVAAPAVGVTLVGVTLLKWQPSSASTLWSVVFATPLLLTLGVMGFGATLKHRRWIVPASLLVTVLAVLISISVQDYTTYVVERDEAKSAELVPVAEWYRSTAGPDDRMLVFRKTAVRLTNDPLNVPEDRLMNVRDDMDLPDDPTAALAELTPTYVLWSESEMINFSSSADATAAHWRKDIFDALIEGLPGWEEHASFTNRERKAIVYARSSR